MTKLQKNKPSLDDATAETLEVLKDPELARRLRRTLRTIEDDVRNGRLLTFEKVFGEKLS